MLDVRLLPESYGPAGIQGRIVEVERTRKGQRIILEQLQISRLRADHVPSRLRLYISKPPKAELQIGHWIETWGKLKPVPAPTSPGAFDLQRHLYFDQIGAVGFSLSDIKITGPPDQNHFALKPFFDELRHIIITRIDLAMEGRAPEETRALAKTFLTGNKKFIDEETHEEIRASGLAHLLAISGLHIGLVSLLCFVSLRQLMALIPALALRYPIKKWAAFLSIFAALFYTLLTGASIPTLRAFIMCAIVFGAILIDRKAISLRTVALAALCILLIYPESLLSASFQLSFAAVTALVAYYERVQKAPHRLKLFLYFKEIFTTSLIAGLATLPFAAYHFHRIALYGLFSNLIAIPITVFWIMPFGMLSLILMPLGLEKLPLMVMGFGISSLVWVAEQTAALPHALIHTAQIPTISFMLVIAAGLILCLIAHKLRFSGLVFLPIALVIYMFNQEPLLKISQDGKLIALKTQEGGIALSNVRKARFIREKWLEEWGQSSGHFQPMDILFPCDLYGCSLIGAQNSRITYTRHPMAVWEDCQHSDIIISTLKLPSDCEKPKITIDVRDLKEKGAHALYLRPQGYYVVSDKDRRGHRPWTNYGS